jgi:23S rRNA-/tRNA-specific pseudouridylate synthase
MNFSLGRWAIEQFKPRQLLFKPIGKIQSASFSNTTKRSVPAMYVRVRRSAPISCVISETARISVQDANSILLLGAVYYQPKDEIVGEIAETFETKEGAFHLKRIVGDFIAQEGDVVRFYAFPRRYKPILQTVFEMFDPQKVEFDWQSTIIQETENYVLMNKPAGIPCHATVSNFVDNILWILRDIPHNLHGQLALPQSELPTLTTTPIYAPKLDVYLPQRLDTDTSGLLLVAKSSRWISQLGKLLQKKRYRKWYKLLLCYTVSSRDLSQFMSEEGHELLETFKVEDELKSFLVLSAKAPKEYLWLASDCGNSELQDAALRIEKIERPLAKSYPEWSQWIEDFYETIDEESPSEHLHLFSAMNSWLVDIKRKQDAAMQVSSIPADPSENLEHIVFQEVTVELLTGRTHQIRGQFQALQRLPGLPSQYRDCGIHIAGDHMYVGASYSKLLQDVDGIEGASPYLALVSYGLELQVPHPPSSSETMNNNSISSSSTRANDLSEIDLLQVNQPPHISQGTSSNLSRKMKRRNVLEPLKVDLGRCWWSCLYE